MLINVENLNTKSDRAGSVAPRGARVVKIDGRVIVIKRLKTKHALNSDTWRLKGGMMGGSGGSCRAVTGGNGLGVVPSAFVNHIRET
jgi:hypothetical protein